jgi:hypothetical protein
MDENFDAGKFVEEKLEKINSAGEWLGKNLGTFGRAAKNILIAAGILLIFGMAIFFWSIGQGIFKKSK